MGSFKLKLVGFFVILSLLPLAAAFWGFSSIARSSERSRVDARLQASLRATQAAYQDDVSAAGRTAAELAANEGFQQALLDRDSLTLHGMLRDSRDVRVEAADGFRVGDVPPLAAQREVAVLGSGDSVGRVIVSVRLDSTFIARLQRRSGLVEGDRLVLVRDGVEIAGQEPGTPLRAAPGSTTTVEIKGERFRVLVAGVLRDPGRTAFAVVSPQAAIDRAVTAKTRHLLLWLAASLLLIAVLAWALGRSIVRTLRDLVDAARGLARGNLERRVVVRGRDEFAELGRAFNEMAVQLEARVAELEAERVRLRGATARLGDALAATHDVDLLLRVILDTAVESANAAGGWVVVDGGETLVAGSPDPDGEQIELPLRAGRHLFGTLVLAGPGFSVEDAETAASFAAEAVIALENARLHQIVERQAASDGLTGLANRRHCEEVLHQELARTERFDVPVGLVFADLDDFKTVNDRFGHPAGDAVLREFAATVRGAIREVDTAARWGGEEFALVLPGTDLEGASQLAERVRAALEHRTILAPDGSRIRVTASFGVASAPAASTQAELVVAADAALYEAKRSGKNRVVAAGDPVPQI